MANLRIQVIGTSEEYISKGNGKGYNKLTVTYKNLATTLAKVEVKNLMDFANQEVYKKVKALQKDDVVQVTSEKIGDFWNWTEVSRDDGPVPEAVATPSKAGVPAKANTYEVNNSIQQERLKFDQEKQYLIIRQSCLQSACRMSTYGPVPAEEVLAVAEKFEQWVNRKVLGSLNDMQDDIPL